MMKRATRLLPTAAAALALLAATAAPAFADAITKARGRVVDIHGKPMAKVAIYFDAVDIKKKVGPVRTNKQGLYFSLLDRTIAKKWRCYPDLPGYKVVKVVYDMVNSQGLEEVKGEYIPGSKQEFPELPFPLVGDAGRNVVDFVVAKDAEFVAAVQAERRQDEGGSAETAGSPVVGAAPVAETAPPAGAAGGGVQSLQQAKQLTDAGRHEEAIGLYRAYLAKDPKGNPAVYYYLGKSLFESKDDAAAEQAFKEGLVLKPDMKGAHFYLGNIYLRQADEPMADAAGAAARAIEEFEIETQLTPDSDSVAYNLGLAYTKAGQEDKALAALERAVTLNPQRSEAYLKMASIYEHRKDMARAEEMYQKFSAADPANAAVSFYNIGVIAWNENRNKEAAQYFRKAVEIDPKYAPAHRELARTLMASQDFAGALKHFQEYLKLNPKAADAKEIQDNIAVLK
jgi:tetratricopeptide (TPR) repeat protein